CVVSFEGVRRGAGAAPPAPKAAFTWSPRRPAIWFCRRDAAFKRLTSVLPSRLASRRLRSSAILSNSASKSWCLVTASSTFWLAGHESPLLAPPLSIVEGRPKVGEPFESFGGGGLSLGLGGCCEDSRSTMDGTLLFFGSSFEPAGGLPASVA